MDPKGQAVRFNDRPFIRYLTRFDRATLRPYDCAAMAWVDPQDCFDVPLAARRNSAYDCEFTLDSQSSSFGRLASVVDSLVAVSAQFVVSTDDYGRPYVSGQTQATVIMPCQRCLEGVQTQVQTELGQVIWFGDEIPTELAKSDLDVVLSDSKEMTFAALIEDDLLLALPQQVCQLESCERLPVLAYPAPGYTSAAGGTRDRAQHGAERESPEPADATDQGLPDDRQLPFAGLKDLLAGKSEEQ